MSINLKTSLCGLLLSMLAGLTPAAQPLQLLGRSTVEEYAVSLDEADWSWLRQKRTLRLGASAPDYPPFGIITDENEYEGITADYAQLIAQLLHIKVEILRYDSRAQVIDALKVGEIDMLATAKGYEAADLKLAISKPYADDKPTLATRVNESQQMPTDLAGKQIAMFSRYMPLDKVSAFYPNANIKQYPSALSAIGAVAFGQADVFLGDSISTNYLITKNYLNKVQLTDFSPIKVRPFGFAVLPENQRLLRILDAAILTVPANVNMSILRRWGGEGISLPGGPKLHFSIKEQRWMDQHPLVLVGINRNFLPLTFNDDGKFRGISVDVLAKISLRTGLKFDLVSANSDHDLIKQVTSGKVDMLAAFTPSIERDSKLHFTRPYLTTPFVLVTPIGTDPVQTIEQMVGKRLALINNNVLHEYLVENFPRVQLVVVDNAESAMSMVARGEVDGAIEALISADYMIIREYRNRLQITSTVSVTPERIALATNRGALELYSILDKALLSIPPQEMDELTNRWRHEVVIGDGYWPRHRSVIIQGFAIAGVLLLIALGWITYLRLLMRKRRLVKIALKNQVEFMHALIDGTPHPIYVRDHAGRLLICNSAYLQAFGVDRETVMGKTVGESVLDEAQAEAFDKEYLEVMGQGLPRVQDRNLTLPQGQVITIYDWMLPYRDSDGAVNGIIGGWIDVSERQQLLEQLQIAKDGAEDANRAKTTFLATMSHEIRTPMNAVIGMLELAMKKADQGVLDRFAIEVAFGSARNLLDLIGDILDISRIESGRLSLAPERANLRELIESVARIFEGVARQKQLRLQLELDTSSNVDVLIDPLRFKQVLSNLLSNAIKFTDSGSIRLIMQAQAVNDHERLELSVRVEDSGRGISEEDQQRLFTPFVQAANHDQSARGGSGLGLVISRTLCEMMGGTLSMSSTLGQGTQVEICLCLQILEPLAKEALVKLEPETVSQILNVLVVDDYPANRALLSQQLNYLGHRVTEAEDGAHGLCAWRNESFDVVITDCNMPIMNGYELALAIRDEELARGWSRALVIGFTANALPEEKGRCVNAGMDDCLFKPISLETLNARLAKVKPKTPLPSEDVLSCHTGLEINLSSLEQLSQGDPASIRSLLTDLSLSNEADMAKLMRLFSAHDLPGLADLAHRVKGGARIISAESLIAACEALEVATEELSPVALTEAVDALQKVMEQLADYLEPKLR